jgi:hypothetical protein
MTKRTKRPKLHHPDPDRHLHNARKEYLEIQPLVTEAVTQLVETLLREGRSTGAVVAAIIQTTCDTAFFTGLNFHQFVAAIVESWWTIERRENKTKPTKPGNHKRRPKPPM